MIQHTEIKLKATKRGFNIITDEILNAIGTLPQVGILFLFIKHTSAGISINENSDPLVLEDFESGYNRMVPEGHNLYRHDMEGLDDMPAHIKSSMTGHSLHIPIMDSRLCLGIWQGIYLCEFRNYSSGRTVIASVYQ